MAVFSKLSSLIDELPDYVFYFLPIAIWFFFALSYFFSKKKAGMVYFFSLIHTLLGSLFLLKFPLQEALLAFALSLFFSLCFLPLGRITRKKREKKSRQDPVTAFNEEFLSSELPVKQEPHNPQKILVGGENMASGEDVYSLEKEKVNLNHAIGVALQLKRANLNVADRLETDGIYKTLSLYRAKNDLSREEADTLNGYLSTLLKLMAKYSL